jgi:uroporphyrinogen decarboxylase
LNYVLEAIARTTTALGGQVPLLGFAGSPWTLATYMIEGGTSKSFNRIKAMLYAHPERLHRLLQRLAEAVGQFLIAQIEAGASAVQLFDTWGGVLGDQEYSEFSLAYMAKIVAMVKAALPKAPIILFTKSGGRHLEQMANTGCDALGIDWTISLSEARSRVGDRIALQGNLDPSVLYADTETIKRKVREILKVYNGEPGHIFNLGHGIHPDIDPERVADMVETVYNFRCDT